MPHELPASDDATVTEALGAKGYHDDVALVQYAAWAVEVGMLQLLEAGPVSVADIERSTRLTEAGVDAIGGVLVATGMVRRPDASALALTTEAAEYLLPSSPYFMGESLFVTCSASMPAAWVDPQPVSTRDRVATEARRQLRRIPNAARARLRPTDGGWRLGSRRRLENQHSRNLPNGVAAARLPLFDGVESVIDVGGGTGTFAIPFLERNPDARVVLTDLPDAMEGIEGFLSRAGVRDRVDLVAMDVLESPWPVPRCDAAFFGNLIHVFDDAKTSQLAAACRPHVRSGGFIVFHELVWNDDRTGPLKTALFNATMRSYAGRQRTVEELIEPLTTAGFVDPFSHPTRGGFAAVGAYAP
ncbi:MAG: methyltransferase [Actinomycetota bacterium]